MNLNCSTMQTAFKFELGQQVLPGLICLARFEPGKPTLVATTIGGKVLLHSVHDGEQRGAAQDGGDVRSLNFNRKITALTAGSLSSGLASTVAEAPKGDVLFIGTESTLTAYDVQRNAELFFCDTPDGCNDLSIINWSPKAAPTVIAGGNCSILGFDEDGEETLWTVTGDNVRSLAMLDVDNDGNTELLVGGDDFEIRCFRKEELLYEITEADRVLFLKALHNDFFAYGLANGTVGVYSGPKARAWRVKTKYQVTALLSFDIDGDGVPEVVIGFSHGLVMARRMHNGEVIYRQTFASGVAGLLACDYKLVGKEQLIIVTEAGEIVGLSPPDDAKKLVALTEQGHVKDSSTREETLQKLQEKKLELSTELRNWEQRLAIVKSSMESGGTEAVQKMTKATAVNNDALVYGIDADEEGACVNLLLTVKEGIEANLVSVVAVDQEGTVFESSEIVATSPSLGSKEARLALRPHKMLAGRLRVQSHFSVRSGAGVPFSSSFASVGGTSSSQSQLAVVEVDLEVPRFVGFKQLADSKGRPKPTGVAVISIPETTARLAEFVQANFLLPLPLQVNAEKLRALFCLVLPPKATGATDPSLQSYAEKFKYVGAPLYILGKANSDGASINISIHCDCMELASEVVQEIARFFKMDEMEAEADFPAEVAYFRTVLDNVSDSMSSRTKLGADMAEDSQRVKALVVRAEDSRLLNDMKTMRRAYTELHAVTSRLTGGYNIRAANHANLLTALADVNQMIHRAANLRVGRAKSELISKSRAALKKNNMQGLLRILSGTGSGASAGAEQQ